MPRSLKNISNMPTLFNILQHPLNHSYIIVNWYRIYKDELITTTFKKHTLKKLILDCCSKTAFSFDEQICVQQNGVSMGSSLGPVLANIILTEFERLIVSELIADGTIKFYKRYVDDTLVLIKPSDISAVLAKFNSFDLNLTFTVDTFSEGIVHFLDIKVSVDGTDIYRKVTHTGQYSHFSSFEPFYRKTAWVKFLYHRAFKICSTKSLLNNQIEIIKSFMSWNGYPKSIQNSLMKKLKTNYSDSSTSVTVNEDTVDNLPKIWIRILYLGSRGDFLLKSCLNKVQRFLSKPVKFITIYDTKKFSYFVSNKDKLPPLSRSNVVYEVAQVVAKLISA